MLQLADRNVFNPQLRFASFSSNSTVNECLIWIAQIEFATPIFNSQGFRPLCFDNGQQTQEERIAQSILVYLQVSSVLCLGGGGGTTLASRKWPRVGFELCDSLPPWLPLKYSQPCHFFLALFEKPRKNVENIKDFSDLANP